MGTDESCELETTRVPSLENETDRTQPKFPSSLRSTSPVVAFQIRTLLSPEPDTTRVPSFENATEDTM